MDFTSANFQGARLAKAEFRHCAQDGALLQDADLQDAGIRYSTCDATAFKRAKLHHLTALGTSFTHACFEDAEQFSSTPEVIVEILRRHICRDFEFAKLLAAVSLMGHWSYSEWKKNIDTPDLRMHYQKALEILKAYPASGAFDALERGQNWRNSKER